MAKGKNMDNKFIKGNTEGPNSPKHSRDKGGNYAHRDQGSNIPNKGNLNVISKLNQGNNKPQTDS